MNVFAADVRPLYGLPAECLTQQNRTSVRRQFWLSAGHIMPSRQTHASVMGRTALTMTAHSPSVRPAHSPQHEPHIYPHVHVISGNPNREIGGGPWAPGDPPGGPPTSPKMLKKKAKILGKSIFPKITSFYGPVERNFPRWLAAPRITSAERHCKYDSVSSAC